jgi:Tfp pilus assembly protein PilO
MAQLTELRHNSQIMPKQIPQDELDAILEAVTQFPEGASVENLSETLEKKMPRIDHRHFSRLWHFR